MTPTAEESDTLREVPRAIRAAAAVLRPPEDISPSEFAEKYRHLKPGTTWQPGRWSNEVFPYLVPIMDAVAEALDKGYYGLVLMKSGQGGGSEAIINALLWIKAMFSGPLLYLISKDELAEEFSRDRFGYANKTCPPVAAKSLTGYGSGASLHQLRYVDGKLTIHGSGSLLNIKSEPRRVVCIDEIDDFPDDTPEGDALKIAEIRTDAFMGPTLIIAFAHPTTKSRGAGRIYYGSSDQRRGHVACPFCQALFWLSWNRDVKVEPLNGQSLAHAEREPACYVYRTPCCNEVLTDAARWSAIAAGVEQISTLPPEIAKGKNWIGVHFGQLYMSNKTLRFLAEKWIEGIDDPSIARVVVNKRHGDCYTDDIESVDADAWNQLRGAHHRGTVPAWCSYLTAGTDANSRHLHFTIWGWGLRNTTAGQRVLCGALIEWGEIERPAVSLALDAADLAALDVHLIETRYSRLDDTSTSIRATYGDSGWQPTAVYEWARTRRGCTPVKGGADDDRSPSPIFRWGKVPDYLVDGELVKSGQRLGVINTYKAKEKFFGQATARFELLDKKSGEATPDTPRLVLPEDVDGLFLDQAGSEYKATDGKKKTWRHRGPNHLCDCSIYGYVAALNLATVQRGKTAEELKHGQQRSQGAQRQRADPASRGQTQRSQGVRREY